VGPWEPYRPGSRHHFRVRFHLRNYSVVTRQLHAASEILPSMLPVLSPSRVPTWDSGWDDNYRSNEFFGDTGPLRHSTAEDPLILRVPLRRLFVIGHRGAPYHYPENTLASFQEALSLGATGLEFDLCITRDRRIVLFHDPRPDRLRILFERFPYELVSPEISGRWALLKELRDGQYIVVRRRLIGSSSLDIRNRTLAQVGRWYRYQHVAGVEHGIPHLEQFLEFASRESGRLQLLFFDVKDPGWRFASRLRLRRYGRLLGSILRRFARLPPYLVIAHPGKTGLASLREGIRSAGEERCLFAFDAAGGFGALFGFKEDPLAVARAMDTEVVSIGARFRAGDREEVLAAARDRDYNATSAVSLVLHWTLNDPETMQRSLKAGINGIVTDRPEVLRRVLAELGLFA
jgi:glycerophosphoryl diester phosphodiesterase